jgi:formylglycine-generating enzyme required for sulfatase activity
MNERTPTSRKSLNWTVFFILLLLGSISIGIALNRKKNAQKEFERYFRPRPSRSDNLNPDGPELVILADPKVVSRIKANMILVEGGRFKMGCGLKEEDCSFITIPRHSVNVTSFQINKFEVTRSEWLAVMGRMPKSKVGSGCPECPVVDISWNEIQIFLRQLSALDSGKHDFRLPTEAEWEYAARGGKETNGFIFSGSDSLDEVAWFRNNSGGKYSAREHSLLNMGQDDLPSFHGASVHPVGTKQPNELNLYDMSGNAAEYCEDLVHIGYEGAPRDGSAWLSTPNQLRIMRGENWLESEKHFAVWDRSFAPQSMGSIRTGFRIARDKE